MNDVVKLHRCLPSLNDGLTDSINGDNGVARIVGETLLSNFTVVYDHKKMNSPT